MKKQNMDYKCGVLVKKREEESRYESSALERSKIDLKIHNERMSIC